jgi:hypothetical protein
MSEEIFKLSFSKTGVRHLHTSRGCGCICDPVIAMFESSFNGRFSLAISRSSSSLLLHGGWGREEKHSTVIYRTWHSNLQGQTLIGLGCWLTDLPPRGPLSFRTGILVDRAPRIFFAILHFFPYCSLVILKPKGRAITQEVSRRIPTATTRVRT